MQNTAVVRLIGERLAWYPPGAGTEPQWLDSEPAADKLRAALSQRRLKVCFAAPGAQARLLEMPVTAAEKKHLAKSLPFMLEEEVAADVEDLHFSYTTLDDDRVTVAVCDRAHMDHWRQHLAPFTGINQWLPETLLLPRSAGEWCVVLEDDTAIVRLDESAGFTVEKALLETLLLSVLDTGLEPSAVSRKEPSAAGSKEPSAASNKQPSAASIAEPSAIILYGTDQSADIALLPAALQDKVQWRQGDLCSALMLADDGALNLNLLQGSYAPRLPLGRWWGYWRAVAAVFAVAFLLQLAAGYADYRNLSENNIALRGAVEASYRQAFPKGAVVDAEKQLKRQLDALRGSGQTSGFVSLMEQVGGVIADMPGTSIATINYNDKGDEMRMNLIATDFESVEQLRSRINAVGLEAVMESSSAQDKKVRARLRVGKRS